MIDLHCHILPHMDDGSGSTEESLEMARIAVDDGITRMVATPHTLNGLYVHTAAEIRHGVSALQAALDAAQIPLKLFPGADVHLADQLVRRVNEGEVCTINDAKQYLLLELPSQSVPWHLRDAIFELKLHRITPIITHPERNLAIQNDPRILEQMIQMGALAQVTAMSLVGDFGEAVHQCAVDLLERGLVHVIATDAHSASNRPPLLRDAVDAASNILQDTDYARQMVVDWPTAILTGKSFPVPEPQRPGKGKIRPDRGPIARLWRGITGRR